MRLRASSLAGEASPAHGPRSLRSLADPQARLSRCWLGRRRSSRPPLAGQPMVCNAQRKCESTQASHLELCQRHAACAAGGGGPHHTAHRMSAAQATSNIGFPCTNCMRVLLRLESSGGRVAAAWRRRVQSSPGAMPVTSTPKVARGRTLWRNTLCVHAGLHACMRARVCACSFGEWPCCGQAPTATRFRLTPFSFLNSDFASKATAELPTRSGGSACDLLHRFPRKSPSCAHHPTPRARVFARNAIGGNAGRPGATPANHTPGGSVRPDTPSRSLLPCRSAREVD